MDNYHSTPEYNSASCAGCQGAGMPTGLSTQGPMPTLEDVASYNYMNPLQKQQFSQQLKSMGNSHPAVPSPSRNAGAQPPMLFTGAGGSQIGAAQVPVTSGQFPGIASSPVTGAPMPASPAAQAALMPTGGGGTMSTGALNPTLTQPITINSDSIQYLNGFLRTQIGRPVLIEFLIGTNTLVDRSGTLIGVGVNYILIQEAETDDIVACDFYNIKFVKFYY